MTDGWPWRRAECEGCRFEACCRMDALRPMIAGRYVEVCPHREEAGE